MKFLHREDAAMQLMKALHAYRQTRAGVVLALPRGGVPIGRYIADELQWPLDVAIVKKIRHSLYPEFAIGAVSLTGYVLNRHMDIAEEYVEQEIHQQERLIREKYMLYRRNIKPLPLKNKIAMLVDDGMATGSTMLGAIALVRKESPQQVVVAVPVASHEACHKVSRKADAVICLQVPDDFQAVGQFYEVFPQVSDEVVIALLQ